MLLLMLEAFAALAALLAIVWWTMFSGRPKGELTGRDDSGAPPPVQPPSAKGPPAPPKAIDPKNP